MSYLFRRENGELIELDLEWHDLDTYVRLESGELVRRDVPAEIARDHAAYQEEQSRPRERRNVSAWTKPLESLSMSVHPHQVELFNQRAREQGYGESVRWTKTGRCLITSRQGRNRAMRDLGFFDKDASYGDVAELRQ